MKEVNRGGQDPMDQLKEIHSLMERSAKFISLSGLSGIWAGCCALAAAFVAYKYFGNEYQYHEFSHIALDNSGELTSRFAVKMILLGLCTLFIAVLGAWFFTARKANSLGEKAWGDLSKRMVSSLAIPIFSGAALCLILMHQQMSILIPSVTLIFYGLALVSASQYTYKDIKLLGISEIAVGLVAAHYLDSGLIFWAIGFGLLHIVYGGLMFLRHD